MHRLQSTAPAMVPANSRGGIRDDIVAAMNPLSQVRGGDDAFALSFNQKFAPNTVMI